MREENLVLTGYSSESCSPCELIEIVVHVKKRDIVVAKEDKVGLSKNIRAIPLNKGYMLYSKDNVLVTNTLKPLLKIDGTHALGRLITSQEMEVAFQQLHYYNLLSFGSNEGRLTIINIPPKYEKKYQNGDFAPFTLIPLTVELDITNSCNFSCIHCSRDSKPSNKVYSGDELSKEELFSIINGCGRIGVPELLLMGGEPLVHPEFFNLVQYAKEKGILHIRTSTNGWLIDESIARELSKYTDNIQISIHGASSATHDYIVGKKGAWERAKKAVRILKEHNLKVNISFTVMRVNVADIKKMPYLVKEWGADSLRFLRLIGQGRGHLLKGWTEGEVTKIGNEIKNVHDALPFNLELEAGGFASLVPLRNDACFYGCAAGKTLLCILSNGAVKSCGSMGEDAIVGQIREEGLLDIWHSPHLVSMRRRMDCDDCSYRSICWGPCRVTS